MKVIAIVPAHNEEKNIVSVVNSILKQNIDVVVINDGSIDNTAMLAKQAGATVLDLCDNLGIGGAVQTGYKYAIEYNYDYVVQIDGDNQHNPIYIKDMFDVIKKENVDMVIGSRFLKETNYNQKAFRKIGISIITIFIYLFSKRLLTDPTSGYRMVNKRIAIMFANEYPFDFPEPETNLKLILLNYKIKEISVVMRHRKYGKTFVTPFKASWYMMKVFIALLVQRIKVVKK